MSHILIVDDEPSICWALEQALSEDGHTVTTTATAEAALDITNDSIPDVIVMDVRLPGVDGLDALHQLRTQIGTTPVVMITAFGNLETAVQAINRGAFEYLTKPFDLDQAIQVIRRALDAKLYESDTARNDEPDHSDHQLILGSSAAMQSVFRDIAIVAERDVPVLITGESGTGKELVAAAIHHYSKRAKGPFIPVCIPAMSETVIESELFGHAKGAFTGAVEKRNGLLEAAHHGTAFFDEIGDVSIPTQVKLLRVIESKAITPVGGNEARQSDFRLLAATNRNLESMVADGTFREDLYYRLNVYRIEIPPLRDRTEDIPILAQHFIQRLDPLGKVTLSDSALKELMSRPWNGNVRELRNAVEHAVIVTRSGEIAPSSLPTPMSEYGSERNSGHGLNSAIREWIRNQIAQHSDTPDSINLHEMFLGQFEPLLLSEALRLTNGNRQEAASFLGIHRQTLRDKIRKYEMDGTDVG